MQMMIQNISLFGVKSGLLFYIEPLLEKSVTCYREKNQYETIHQIV
jgi:hypothetical protein